jgi:sigma-B regulation protein RsbU (phosphoserine phosphatase)
MQLERPDARQAPGLRARPADHLALLELQAALQPPVPELLDPELGVRYVPADRASAGGDIYDWLVLRDGSLHLAVIDVVGKGLSALRDALTIVHAIRLLAIAGTAVGSLVEAADNLLSGAYPDLSATAVVARYDCPSGALLIANGGHPPPLLIEPDGSTRYLYASGRAIGWPQAGSDEVVSAELVPGAAVVFYTDGLIEAHRNAEEGLRELATFGNQLAGTPAAVLAHTLVLQVLADADRHDDTLAVVLRRPLLDPLVQ